MPNLTEVVPMDSKRKITARVDLESVREVKDVALGEMVELRIRGKVCSMRGPEESLYKDQKGKEVKSLYPGTLEVEISKLEVSSPGEFDGLDD